MRILVRQISGLGNQLSQYAAGRYFAKRYGAEMELLLDPPRNSTSHGYPRPFLLSHFHITTRCRKLGAFDRVVLAERAYVQPLGNLVRAMSGVQVIRETVAQRYRFQKDLKIGDRIHVAYLVGYWQAFRYAEEHATELRAELQLRESAKGKNAEMMQHIRAAENPVSVHIRRGDYTLQAEGNLALPMDYYLQGISFFKERSRKPTFFVFSDDMDFARQNLPRDENVYFVDHNDSYSAHEDLRLMSACRGHIIANSTFSWWGAWLNPDPRKIVFSPKYWHRKQDSYYPDLLSPNWILAESESPVRPGADVYLSGNPTLTTDAT